jgi:hypothetical protein
MTVDVEVGTEIFGDVFVRGGQKETGASLFGETVDVEGDDPRERAVERGGEFVGNDPGGLL